MRRENQSHGILVLSGLASAKIRSFALQLAHTTHIWHMGLTFAITELLFNYLKPWSEDEAWLHHH